MDTFKNKENKSSEKKIPRSSSLYYYSFICLPTYSIFSKKIETQMNTIFSTFQKLIHLIFRTDILSFFKIFKLMFLLHLIDQKLKKQSSTLILGPYFPCLSFCIPKKQKTWHHKRAAQPFMLLKEFSKYCKQKISPFVENIFRFSR